jgi:hypothetical protein
MNFIECNQLSPFVASGRRLAAVSTAQTGLTRVTDGRQISRIIWMLMPSGLGTGSQAKETAGMNLSAADREMWLKNGGEGLTMSYASKCLPLF